MSAWTTIQALLDARLNTLAGGTPIAWEGRLYVPTVGTQYLKTNLLTASSDSAGVGAAGGEIDRGTYQVTVVSPAGLGTGVANAKADAIAAHFKRATLGGVQCAVPARGPVLVDGTWLIVPVSIPFFCHTPLPAPAITAFTVTPATGTAGSERILAATFTGGTGVITPGSLVIVTGGTVSVTPSITTTYTLTVTNLLNETSTATATVTVTP